MINKLKALLDAAAPGPWSLKVRDGSWYTLNGSEYSVCIQYQDCDEAPDLEDAQLIVAMRNVLPELLTVVEAVQASNTNNSNIRQALAALEEKLKGL